MPVCLFFLKTVTSCHPLCYGAMSGRFLSGPDGPWHGGTIVGGKRMVTETNDGRMATTPYKFGANVCHTDYPIYPLHTLQLSKIHCLGDKSVKFSAQDC